MLDFLVANDKYAPDFIKQAVDKQLVRDLCIDEQAPQPLTENEQESIRKLSEEYYEKHWHRIIMPLLKYKHPHVANKEQIALSTLKLSQEEPLYFFVAHVKPGRCTYVVQQS